MSQTIETNLSKFVDTFRRYVSQWTANGNGTTEDALEKKGRDLGIKLFQGFRAHKWGGGGKAPRDLARAELDARVAAGAGIRVRGVLMQEYLTARGNLRAHRDPTMPNGQRWLTTAKINLWQQFVGKELGLRQSGIGVLAASFLWFRSRSSQARGTYYVKNRVGHPLGGVERGEGFFRIVGFTEGLSEVDARYGIAADAIAESEADMRTYLDQRITDQFHGAFAFLTA